MNKTATSLLLLCACLLIGCQQQVPSDYEQLDVQPAIYPDYVDVTVPVNIAPLHFLFTGECDEVVARLQADDEQLVLSGEKVCPDADDWQTLVAKAVSDSILVEVFVRKGDKWQRYQPFAIYVSPDSIDPWLTYRLISPSYVTYEELTINQRCLENYEEIGRASCRERV